MSRPPKKSAVAIPLARGPGGELLTLVGRRNPRSRFLGGFYAFPGGVIEPEDGDLESEDELEVLRRTAARELQEETGIGVAPERLHPAGWRVTPPFTPRRFETRMYVVALPEPVAPTAPESGELLELQWTAPADLMDRWRALEIRIAPPLVLMLRRLEQEPWRPADEIAARLAEVNVEHPEVGPRIEFVPFVNLVPVRTPTLPPATHTNCYLLGSKDLVIIDPGSEDPAEGARLERQIQLRVEDGAVPRAILLTHHHGDHVAGAPALARRLRVPILAHPETWTRWTPEPGGELERGELVDGQRIPLSGGERLRVLHTPGHAPGHVALLEETQGSLFVGDLVSGVSTVLVDAAPGSLDRYLESVARLRDCDSRTLFPAHGPPLIHPGRAIQGLLDHRAERERKIVEAIAGGAGSLADIVREAYRDTPAADPFLATAQTRAHLDCLLEHGRIELEGGDYRLVSG